MSGFPKAHSPLPDGESGEVEEGERLPARLLKLAPYPSDDPYARGRTSCTDCQKRDASLAL